MRTPVARKARLEPIVVPSGVPPEVVTTYVRLANRAIFHKASDNPDYGLRAQPHQVLSGDPDKARRKFKEMVEEDLQRWVARHQSAA